MRREVKERAWRKGKGGRKEGGEEERVGRKRTGERVGRKRRGGRKEEGGEGES